MKTRAHCITSLPELLLGQCQALLATVYLVQMLTGNYIAKRFDENRVP